VGKEVKMDVGGGKFIGNLRFSPILNNMGVIYLEQLVNAVDVC